MDHMNTRTKTPGSARHGKWWVKTVIGIGCMLVPAFILLFQAYALVIHEEGSSPLPPLFGNFQANRAFLEEQAPKEEFTFAVIGDTRGYGTFEKIVNELRMMPLDFAVNLGDCTTSPTVESHNYLRAELAEELALPYPVFYVIGNHDVDPRHFPVSRFETDYGPSIFSFEYQDCLFVVLRYWRGSGADEESYEFLDGLIRNTGKEYRHKFAFMHRPPVVPKKGDYPAVKDKHLLELLERFRPDYVFAGHIHAFLRTRLGETNYVVTGGGGAPLYPEYRDQSHHAFLVNVGTDGISETVLPFEADVDLEDYAEYFAIVKVWPWMMRNKVLIVVADIVCLILLVLLSLKFLRVSGRHERTGAI